MASSSNSKRVPTTYRKTRIVCISDTHNQTPKLPQGDVLIHAGDLTNQGSLSELEKTVKWLESTNFAARVVIAGNHDVTLDEALYKEHGLYFHNKHPQSPQACRDLLLNSPSITYLDHSTATIRLPHSTSTGTTFTVFGSPRVPEHGLWAFGYKAAEARGLWSAIPSDVDITVTHTPPRDHCDSGAVGGSVAEGCEELRKALWRVRPKLAVCGHVHNGRGAERVRWRLEPKMPVVKYMETAVTPWSDPGAGMGNKKESRIDLSAKGGDALDNADDWDAQDRDLGRGNHVSFDPADEHVGALRPDAAEDSSLSRSDSIRSSSMFGSIATTTQTTVQQGQRWARLEGRDADALAGRLGRKETCIVNASFMATSYGQHKRYNKPIVVDLDLPVWQEDD